MVDRLTLLQLDPTAARAGTRPGWRRSRCGRGVRSSPSMRRRSKIISVSETARSPHSTRRQTSGKWGSPLRRRSAPRRGRAQTGECAARAGRGPCSTRAGSARVARLGRDDRAEAVPLDLVRPAPPGGQLAGAREHRFRKRCEGRRRPHGASLEGMQLQPLARSFAHPSRLGSARFSWGREGDDRAHGRCVARRHEGMSRLR